VSDTRERLLGIFQDVFDDDEMELQDHFTAEHIEDWDSLNNVKMMVQVEMAFGIRFKTSEVSNLEDVGTLIKLIDSKRAK
jgi:acyl carrier protein